MAELVEHLEIHGYVVRRPNPSDGRSKLVIPTARGIEVIAIAQSLVPEIEQIAARAVGDGQLDRLRQDLVAIQRAAEVSGRAERPGPPKSSFVTSGSACRCTSIQSEPRAGRRG